MEVWLVGAVTALVCFGLCCLLLVPGLGPRILDRPGARSLHERPTPRTGGLAVLVSVAVVAAAAWAAAQPLWLDPFVTGGAALLALISLLDDVHGLPAWLRLVVHVAGAGLLLAGGYGLRALHVPGDGTLWLGPAGSLFVLLFVVWMTNLYNFMDGMDGFAGGMGAIGFGALGTIASLKGDPAYALAALLVAGANLGFLGVNFPPARLFLGDVGAVPMGFLAAAFSLAGVRLGLFALWVPVLVFSPFIVDATVTLLRRLAQGKPVWQAHRSHYYQRLVLLGWGHRKTVLASYAIMLAAAATAIGMAHGAGRVWELAVVLGWCLAYGIIARLIARLERRLNVGTP